MHLTKVKQEKEPDQMLQLQFMIFLSSNPNEREYQAPKIMSNKNKKGYISFVHKLLVIKIATST